MEKMKGFWADIEEILKLKGTFVYYPHARVKPYGELFMIISQDGIEVLAKSTALTGQAYRVLMYMLSKMTTEGYVLLTQKDIAEELGITQQKVSKVIRKLQELNIIETGRPLGRAKSYRVNPELAWKGKLISLEEELKNRRVGNYIKLAKKGNSR